MPYSPYSPTIAIGGHPILELMPLQWGAYDVDRMVCW